MATSGTYAYALAADDLLTEAWERCGLNPELITTPQALGAMRSLMLTLLDWTNQGLNLWQVDIQASVTAAGQRDYTLPLGTSDVLEVSVRNGGSDLPISAIGRQEWMALPDKGSRGRPTMFWLERVNLTPILHLYPVPDAAYPLTYSRIRLPQDITALSQTADVPTLWLEALVAQLSAKLAVKYAPDRVPMLAPMAGEALRVAKEENRERVPFRITPALD